MGEIVKIQAGWWCWSTITGRLVGLASISNRNQKLAKLFSYHHFSLNIALNSHSIYQRTIIFSFLTLSSMKRIKLDTCWAWLRGYLPWHKYL